MKMVPLLLWSHIHLQTHYKDVKYYITFLFCKLFFQYYSKQSLKLLY